MRIIRILIFCLLAGCNWDGASAWADARPARMGIFAKVGETIDLDLRFVNTAGKEVSLKELVRPGVPFILVPAFYDCPRLCGLTLRGVVSLVNALPEKLGEDYTIITYSFNPKEDAELAKQKKTAILTTVKQQPISPGAWEFLVGNEETISKLNNQIGFRVRYADKELEHSSAIFFFSPDGTLRKYLAGVEFNVQKAQQALKK